MLTENPFNLDHENSSYRADYSTLEMKDVKMSSVWWSCLKSEIILFLKAKSLFQKNCVGLLCHGHSLYENSLLQICVLSIPSERELSEFRFVI